MDRAPSQRIIIGIDPGTYILGYGVILVDGRKAHYIDMGVINLKKEKDHFAKLNRIYTGVGEIIERYRPEEMAVEAPFYGKNPQSMITLGRAQGAAIAAGIAHGLQVCEYAPRKVKVAVTGNGAASKEQVSNMVAKTLDVVLNPGYLDATDAIAIALCHFYQTTGPMAAAGVSGAVSAHRPAKSSSSWEDFVRTNPGKVKK